MLHLPCLSVLEVRDINKETPGKHMSFNDFYFSKTALNSFLKNKNIAQPDYFQNLEIPQFQASNDKIPILSNNSTSIST